MGLGSTFESGKEDPNRWSLNSELKEEQELTRQMRGGRTSQQGDSWGGGGAKTSEQVLSEFWSVCVWSWMKVGENGREIGTGVDGHLWSFRV